MMGRTHALAGVVALWALRPLPDVLTPENMLPLCLFSILGALLPDLDASDSLLKHASVQGITPLLPLSAVLHQSFGHRGATHSLLGLAVAFGLALPLAAWLGWTAPVALALGYASHLLCDACTKSGVPLFYPKAGRWHALPRSLRLTTGSQAESTVFVFLSVLALGLLLSLLPLAASSLN